MIAWNWHSSIGDHPHYMYERAFFLFFYIVFDPPPEFSDVTNPSHMVRLAHKTRAYNFNLDQIVEIFPFWLLFAFSLFPSAVFLSL